MSEMNLEDKLCQNLEDSCTKAYKAGQQSMQAKIDDLEKYQRINGECINNLVNEKLNCLNKITMAIAHLDSFDHSKAGMNKLIRSIESALEALRGKSCQ